MEYLMIFSQDDEDLILYHVLKNVSKIRWIDVGANDPVYASVTKFFSMWGGVGINIEPQHSFYNKLLKDRGKDINLELGVSNEPGELKLYGREGSQVASFARKNGLNAKAKPKAVKVKTLKAICEDHLAKGEDVHFMKIDVEGWEKPCLEGMDFDYVKPWILCIEASDPGSSKPLHIEWESIVERAGYTFTMQYKVNRYYVSDEHKDLIVRFMNPQELRKVYNVTKWTDANYNEKIEEFIRRIKDMKILKPARLIYNRRKNRMAQRGMK